jgi:hypothetical protein
MDELELYPKVHPLRATKDGLRAVRSHWKRAVSITLVTMLFFGWAGYRWVTTSTPMDRASAVQLFRAEREEAQTDRAPSDDGEAGREKTTLGASKHERSTKKGRVVAAPSSGNASTTTQASRRDTTSSDRSRASSQETFDAPEEGVYSWDTDGYEQVSGARREFPKESQRIITLNGDGFWTVHHYFSEQREIWTHFHWGSQGAEIVEQRNKVTFGPVTNDSTIDFDPAMLVGPRDLKVGFEWDGSWKGDTYGDYASKVFEHTTLDIGGESVEVWGLEYVINLHGKQEGRVSAEVWLSTQEGITVQEHYVQDIKSNGADYHAEWKQKLQSMHPQH